MCLCFFFFFKQKTAYEIGTGDWSSDVCSSDLRAIVDEFIFTGNNLEICRNANKICNVIISVSGLKSTGLVKYSLP